MSRPLHSSLGVVSVIYIGEEVMNIMELVIQVLEPYCEVCKMCILCHVQILKLVENHPPKLRICRSSVLKRLINLNGHGLWIIFSFHINTKMHNELGDEKHIWKLEIISLFAFIIWSWMVYF